MNPFTKDSAEVRELKRRISSGTTDHLDVANLDRVLAEEFNAGYEEARDYSAAGVGVWFFGIAAFVAGALFAVAIYAPAA